MSDLTPSPDKSGEITARLEAATPGQWFWSGNVDNHSIQLSAHVAGWGTCSIVQFRRSGMQGAEPYFMDDKVMMHRARDLAVYAVAKDALTRDDPRVYRGDIVGIRNPNAELIAHAHEDITFLLGRVNELEPATNPDSLAFWKEDNARLEAQRDAVLALHKPEYELPTDASSWCIECSRLKEDYVLWPCATVKALGVTT